MAAQNAADVRTLVARRVGLGRRVAVLGSDPALLDALRTNKCEVLADPSSLDELKAFSPQTVVAFDGFALDDGASAFSMLALAAPEAEVVFSFTHAGSASAALAALTGGTPPKAFAERDVQRWFSAAGYEVSARDIVVVPHVKTALSPDTESALRQLFEQLNPDAAADRLLVTAKRGPVAREAPGRVAGLLSVVVSSDGHDVSALEGTLSSLLSQQYRPLDLILSSPLSLEATGTVLGKARARAGITVQAVTCDSSNWAARTNAGICLSRGQYLATVEAGDWFSAFHFGSLIRHLSDGTKAWALAVSDPSLPRIFSLRAWLTRRAAGRQSCVIDRERTATFPLHFAEGVEGAEAMRFARLGALFEPACAAPGRKPSMTRAAPSENQLEAVLTVLRSRPLRLLRSLRLEATVEPRLVDVLRERVQRFF